MSLFSADEAKVCSVMGFQIRTLIQNHITQLERAIPEYALAARGARQGLDWECALDNLQERLRAAQAVLPVIGDGPHVMTMDQWVRISNRFAEVRSADDLERHLRHEAEHRAAHAPMPKETPAS